jgi:hypothetical protein
MRLMHPDSKQEIDVDPGAAWRYETQGWRKPADDAPKGNASLEEWQDYARAKGFTTDDLDGKTRDELRAALA